MAEQGQRAKYVDARGNVFNATPEHAEKMGLQPMGEPFVVQSTAADVEEKPAEEKAVEQSTAADVEEKPAEGKAVEQSKNKAAAKAEDK